MSGPSVQSPPSQKGSSRYRSPSSTTAWRCASGRGASAMGRQLPVAVSYAAPSAKEVPGGTAQSAFGGQSAVEPPMTKISGAAPGADRAEARLEGRVRKPGPALLHEPTGRPATQLAFTAVPGDRDLVHEPRPRGRDHDGLVAELLRRVGGATDAARLVGYRPARRGLLGAELDAWIGLDDEPVAADRDLGAREDAGGAVSDRSLGHDLSGRIEERPTEQLALLGHLVAGPLVADHDLQHGVLGRNGGGVDRPHVAALRVVTTGRHQGHRARDHHCGGSDREELAGSPGPVERVPAGVDARVSRSSATTPAVSARNTSRRRSSTSVSDIAHLLGLLERRGQGGQRS